MSPVFGDTWYYLALLNRRDTRHEAACRWSAANARPVVLTDFVLLEVGDAFSRGIAEARTADHHFEQAGFTILLK